MNKHVNVNAPTAIRISKEESSNLLNGAQMRGRIFRLPYSGIISLITKLFINPMNCNYDFAFCPRRHSTLDAVHHKLYHHAYIHSNRTNSISMEERERER